MECLEKRSFTHANQTLIRKAVFFYFLFLIFQQFPNSRRYPIQKCQDQHTVQNRTCSITFSISRPYPKTLQHKSLQDTLSIAEYASKYRDQLYSRPPFSFPLPPKSYSTHSCDPRGEWGGGKEGPSRKFRSHPFNPKPNPTYSTSFRNQIFFKKKGKGRNSFEMKRKTRRDW